MLPESIAPPSDVSSFEWAFSTPVVAKRSQPGVGWSNRRNGNSVENQFVRQKPRLLHFFGPIAQRQSRGLIIPWLQVRILLGPLLSSSLNSSQLTSTSSVLLELGSLALHVSLCKALSPVITPAHLLAFGCANPVQTGWRRDAPGASVNVLGRLLSVPVAVSACLAAFGLPDRLGRASTAAPRSWIWARP
jgi:hypothetical protein